MDHRPNLARIGGELWRATRDHRARSGVALALLVVAKLASVAVPLLLKHAVDVLGAPPAAAAGGLPARMSLLLIGLLLGYALLRFGATLFNELRDVVFSRVAQHVVIGFSQRCFAHLLRLGPRFHMQRETGALIRDIERGTAGVGFLLGAGIFTIVPTLVELVAILAVLITGYDAAFSVAVAVTFCVYAAYTTQLTRNRVLRQRKVNDLDSRAHARLVDALLNVESVKSYVREDFEIARFGEICSAWIDTAVRNQRALSALHIGQGAIIAAGVACVMLLAGERTVQGVMTVGDLVLVNAYVIQICLPLNALGFVFRETRDALVNLEKVFGLLRTPAEPEVPGLPALRLAGGDVRFDGVDFGYEPGLRSLRGIDLHIAAGQTVAVVGGSGSGKSTLARLLMRFYDPGDGRVLIDGQDLRLHSLDSVRSAIGVVPQDTVLFNESIAHNIAYGRPGASHDEIVAAALSAQLHEFIVSLPQQYDTLVGERGVRLSGGERQRLAIARVVLKNPPILVFDEATSALDTRAERAIQRELDRLAVGRTTLIIAHRLSTVVGADRIVVLDKGRIVEQGRHDDLLQQHGLYAQMWALQRQQQQVERLERKLRRERVNLIALVADAVDALQPEIDAGQIQLYARLDAEYAGVLGDPGTLSEVLRDVLRVAVTGTAPQGRLGIRLEAMDGHARLHIEDGRCERPDAGRVPLPAGAAVLREPPDTLGLRSAIERQGGRFSVAQSSASAGVRYAIELPLSGPDDPDAGSATAGVARTTGQPPADRGGAAADAVAGAPVALPDAPVGGLSGVPVLCIDDDPALLARLRAPLSEAGADVIAIAQGSDAVDWLAQRRAGDWPRAIVCGLDGERFGGSGLLRRVRRLETLQRRTLAEQVPALALATEIGPAVRLRALLAGFQAVLPRSAPPAELVAAVEDLTRRAS